MILEVCDICGKNEPTYKIKYKAEKKVCFTYNFIWTKIDICDKCLRKIINAKEEKKFLGMYDKDGNKIYE